MAVSVPAQIEGRGRREVLTRAGRKVVGILPPCGGRENTRTHVGVERGHVHTVLGGELGRDGQLFGGDAELALLARRLHMLVVSLRAHNCRVSCSRVSRTRHFGAR